MMFSEHSFPKWNLNLWFQYVSSLWPVLVRPPHMALEIGKFDAYCHVLSDHRWGLDWQLDLFDHNTVTVYTQLNTIDHNTRATFHSLHWQWLLSLCSTALSPLGWASSLTRAQDLLQTHRLFSGDFTISELNSATTAATNSYGIPCHHSLLPHCPRYSYKAWEQTVEKTLSRNGLQRNIHCSVSGCY
jgi:hypothetical protein